MEQVGTTWRLRPGCEAEYDRLHASVWPQLERRFRELGVSRYAIYRLGDRLFAHMEVEDYDRLLEELADDPVSQAWERAFADLIELEPDGSTMRLRRVWSLAA